MRPADATFKPLTDAEFEAWLDEVPVRRESYARHGAKRQAVVRARIDRKGALMASAMGADLARVAELARQLATAAREIGATYSPGEAGRVLAAAGLPIPDDFADESEGGADKFDEARSLCARIAPKVERFLAELDAEVMFTLPPAPHIQEVVRHAA